VKNISVLRRPGVEAGGDLVEQVEKEQPLAADVEICPVHAQGLHRGGHLAQIHAQDLALVGVHLPLLLLLAEVAAARRGAMRPAHIP